MRIVLTGVPGTGKTSLAKWISRKTGSRLVSINEMVKKKKLFTGKEAGALVARMKPLERELKKALAKEEKVVLEGHLACEFSLPADLVIVTRTKPSVLRKRLLQRNYPKKKTEENVLAEMLDYATVLAEKNLARAKIFEVETSSFQKARKAVEEILRGRGKRFKAGWVSWGRELEKAY